MGLAERVQRLSDGIEHLLLTQTGNDVLIDEVVEFQLQFGFPVFIHGFSLADLTAPHASRRYPGDETLEPEKGYRTRAHWTSDSRGIGFLVVRLTQRDTLKTDIPLILTARIEPGDLEPFDALRKLHFPPDRNLLTAHLTMFHRLPGEKKADLLQGLVEASADTGPMVADVSGVRHLGAGVAFRVDSPELHLLHARLKARFQPYLNPQDQQRWQPHITVQNKVAREKADALFRQLSDGFERQKLAIGGVDLWLYLGGPWRHETFMPFGRATGEPIRV